MKLYSENKEYKLYEGSMLDMLEFIDEESIDSIITDPPYELNFMNKGWDNSGIAFQKETWEKCLKVLKPGGYLLAFGGSRTYHRIACAIEDAGFEIRDTIMWLYGSGFPKSLNIGLAIDKKLGVESEVIGRSKGAGTTGNNNVGNQTFVSKNQYDDGTYDLKQAQNEWVGWGTALKPAYEPIIVARKPIKTTIAENVLKYGVGGINIDECRIETEEARTGGRKDGTVVYGITNFRGQCGKVYTNGRFPANVILTYDDTDFEEVCGNMPESDGAGGSTPNVKVKGYGNGIGTGESVYTPNDRTAFDSGSGSVSRYFYCAKASKKDRDDGLDEFEEKNMRIEQNRDIHSAGCEYIENGKLKQNPHLQSSIKKNIHPTVKPIELMQYLIRLVSPKGSTILDCFNGSGSTGKAVMYENREKQKNYKYIGIELTPEYLPIAKARIESAQKGQMGFDLDLWPN